MYLIDQAQGLLGVKVTLAGHVRARLACVMLSNKLWGAATAGVTLAVSGYAALAVPRVLALLAACTHFHVVLGQEILQRQ